MKKLATASFTVSSALALTAFGDDGGTSKVGVVTYKIGLATGFVDYTPQRQPDARAHGLHLDRERRTTRTRATGSTTTATGSWTTAVRRFPGH